jgi:hypothetical protein
LAGQRKAFSHSFLQIKVIKSVEKVRGYCRLAYGIARRAAELVGPEPEVPVAATVAPAALPEAAASVNCHIMLEGRQVQITLRDTDETRLLERLTAVLRQYPVLPSQTGKNQRSASSETPGDKGQPDWCPIHQVSMKRHENAKGTWYSHFFDGRHCKGR